MQKFLFWAILISLLVYGHQQGWFTPIGDFFNMVKGDIEYQRSLVPTSEEIDDGGILSIEEGEKKVVRRSALGTVYGGQ
ncbi:hypothetical protein IJD44_10865 [bacterium]|nr:hypothetical protein [bacterium]